jgi:hypothetical protein
VTYREPVHVGKNDVEYHSVVGLFLNHPDGIFAAADDIDREGPLLQSALEESRDLDRILDYQDTQTDHLTPKG